MFEHIRILGAISNLVVGTWLIFYVLQKSKSFKYDYLKHIIHLIIFFNSCILMMLLAKYFTLNLAENFSSNFILILRDIMILIILVLLHGMTFSLLNISFKLRNEKIPTKYKIWMASGLAIIGFCYGVKIFSSQDSTSSTWLNVLLGFAIANLAFLDFKFPTGMIRYGNKNKDVNEAKISKAFGYFYISRFIFTITIFIIQGLIFWWDIPELIHLVTKFQNVQGT